MKSVTEFFTHKLVKGIESKTALEAEGKTPEEIQASIGEAFKLEGDKLKHFLNSMTVATEHMENLARIQVISLNEDEAAPAKSIKIEDHHYIPDFRNLKPPPAKGLKKSESAGRKDKKKSGPRPSPWGMSPEEEAAKKLASKKAQLAKK